MVVHPAFNMKRWSGGRGREEEEGKRKVKNIVKKQSWIILKTTGKRSCEKTKTKDRGKDKKTRKKVRWN